MALLFADSTSIAITSFISPYAADRLLARQLHEKVGIPFIEIYVDIPIEIAEQRDPKGLYKKARNGEIKEFTGISAPYEIPKQPELVIKTAEVNVVEGVEQIIEYLISKKLIDV